jgi:hypothetical protein
LIPEKYLAGKFLIESIKSVQYDLVQEVEEYQARKAEAESRGA